MLTTIFKQPYYNILYPVFREMLLDSEVVGSKKAKQKYYTGVKAICQIVLARSMRIFIKVNWLNHLFLHFPVKKTKNKTLSLMQTNAVVVIGYKAVQTYNGSESFTNKTHHYRHYQIAWKKHFDNTQRFGWAPNGITWDHWDRFKKWISVSMWTSWTGVGQARNAERKSAMLEPRSPSAASWTGCWQQEIAPACFPLPLSFSGFVCVTASV